MAEPITYKGLTIWDVNPTGAAGLAINNNAIHIADKLQILFTAATITRSESQSIANNTWTKILFDTPVYDYLPTVDGGAICDILNNRMNIPVTGKYILNVCCSHDGANFDIAILKNEGGSPMVPEDAIAIGLKSMMVGPLSFSANDFLHVYVKQATGSAVVFSDFTHHVPYFSIQRVA